MANVHFQDDVLNNSDASTVSINDVDVLLPTTVPTVSPPLVPDKRDNSPITAEYVRLFVDARPGDICRHCVQQKGCIFTAEV